MDPDGKKQSVAPPHAQTSATTAPVFSQLFPRSPDREQVRQIVWIPRGSVLWPAELQEDFEAGQNWFKYLGPKPKRVPASQQRTILPFEEHANRLVGQSSDPDFRCAVAEATQIFHSVNNAPIRRSIASRDVKFSSEKSNSTQNKIQANLSLGTRVMIRSASTMLPKLQQFVNSEAVVVQPPRNPDSGYCVRLSNGSIVKIRRSGVEPLDRSDEKSTNLQDSLKEKLPQRPSLYRRNAPRDSKNKRKLISLKVEESSPKRKKPQSSGGKRNGKSNLVGKYVMIECGRYKGETGFVVRGGNGYYCVQLGGRNGSSSAGNVMKRSSDLRAIPSPNEANESSRQGAKGSPPHQNGRSEDGSSACKNELWVHQKVFIKAGKHQGKTGTVRRSGHGFYCVNIKSIGEVMKRASDLELCEVMKRASDPKRASITGLETEKDQKRKSNTQRMSSPKAVLKASEHDQSMMKKAASILMDMRSLSEDEESEMSEGGFEVRTESKKPLSPLRGVGPNTMPLGRGKPKTFLEAHGLDAELNTPILRGTGETNLMTWDHPRRSSNAKMENVQLPKSNARRGDSYMVNHTLSSYW
mmetsp:Transcript_3102/g.7228  ORF Transcript_3102/g.7228 Transcript_3102/m.7228 type:complete len:582 (-) Transcript_3102:552-2297(-)